MDAGLVVSLFSGAFAGLAVDLSLYPLDTLKTRLQSPAGLWASGGLSSLYAGLPSVAVGSAPGSAVFFLTYESVKRASRSFSVSFHVTHVIASACGEVAACMLRVPMEVIKQRAQANARLTVSRVVASVWARDGLAGLYRGFGATVAREIPFSAIQFPLWEYLKKCWSDRRQKPLGPFQSALCGSISGAIAGALTTPLDVAKTRLMLSLKVHGQSDSTLSILRSIWRVQGVSGLFAGVVPRILWLAVGGFVFLGSFDFAKAMLQPVSFSVRSETIGREVTAYRLQKGVQSLLIKDNMLPDRQVTFDELLKETEDLRERRQRWPVRSQ